MWFILLRLAVRLGLLKADFLTKFVDSFPDSDLIADDELLVVRNGDTEKWACLKCPGGCGKVISLSLNPTKRPRWNFKQDFWRRPTITPSVHQKNECRCHFWIRKGKTDWCPNGKPR